MSARLAIYARVSTTNHGQDAALQTRELPKLHVAWPRRNGSVNYNFICRSTRMNAARRHAVQFRREGTNLPFDPVYLEGAGARRFAGKVKLHPVAGATAGSDDEGLRKTLKKREVQRPCSELILVSQSQLWSGLRLQR